MKILLGLIIFSSSFSALAGSTNGILLLRARVPASTRVVVEMKNKRPVSRIITNGHSKFGQPNVQIERKNSHYLVSVTHP